MLPKVTIPEQVNTLVRLFEIMERQHALVPGTLKMETMVEATQIIMDDEGRNPLMKIIRAGEGRCIAAHFGTYDYTASCGITAKYQTMDHPVCDFAHHMTKVALGGTGHISFRRCDKCDTYCTQSRRETFQGKNKREYRINSQCMANRI